MMNTTVWKVPVMSQKTLPTIQRQSNRVGNGKNLKSQTKSSNSGYVAYLLYNCEINPLKSQFSHS